MDDGADVERSREVDGGMMIRMLLIGFGYIACPAIIALAPFGFYVNLMLGVSVFLGMWFCAEMLRPRE